MKKKILKPFFAVCSASALFFITASSALSALSGDMNKSYSVTSADARFVLRAAVGLENLASSETELADVNGDGTVTSADAREILRMSVGLADIKPFYKKEIITPPTCTNPGFCKKKCTEPSGVKPDGTPFYYEYYENLPALGHTTELGQCTRCGENINHFGDITKRLEPLLTDAVQDLKNAGEYIEKAAGYPSYLPDYAVQALPEYENARLLYSEAANICGNIAELAEIRTQLMKAERNIFNVLEQIENIKKTEAVTISNFNTLIKPVDENRWAAEDISLSAIKKIKEWNSWL